MTILYFGSQTTVEVGFVFFIAWAKKKNSSIHTEDEKTNLFMIAAIHTEDK